MLFELWFTNRHSVVLSLNSNRSTHFLVGVLVLLNQYIVLVSKDELLSLTIICCEVSLHFKHAVSSLCLRKRPLLGLDAGIILEYHTSKKKFQTYKFYVGADYEYLFEALFQNFFWNFFSYRRSAIINHQ